MRSQMMRILLSSALCLVQLMGLNTLAQTEQTRQVTLIQDMSSVGLLEGQTLRYTRANLNDPDPQKRLFEPMRIQVKLLAADGDLVAQDGAAAVGVGQSQSFDFNRSQLILPGDPGTGRLQLRLEVTVIGRSKWPNIVLKQGILETFNDNAEIVDNASGRTVVSLGGGANEMILNDSSGTEKMNRGVQIASAGNVGYQVGFVRGQRLRITVLYPIFLDQSGPPPQFKALVKLFVADGSQIASSEETEIPGGGFRSFDFDAGDLQPSATGRLQVRVEVNGRFFPGVVNRISQGDTSAELVDIATGKTSQHLNPGSFQIISAGRN